MLLEKINLIVLTILTYTIFVLLINIYVGDVLVDV